MRMLLLCGFLEGGGHGSEGTASQSGDLRHSGVQQAFGRIQVPSRQAKGLQTIKNIKLQK
jgi:hypothetical protein